MLAGTLRSHLPEPCPAGAVGWPDTCRTLAFLSENRLGYCVSAFTRLLLCFLFQDSRTFWRFRRSVNSTSSAQYEYRVQSDGTYFGVSGKLSTGFRSENGPNGCSSELRVLVGNFPYFVGRYGRTGNQEFLGSRRKQCLRPGQQTGIQSVVSASSKTWKDSLSFVNPVAASGRCVWARSLACSGLVALNLPRIVSP